MARNLLRALVIVLFFSVTLFAEKINTKKVYYGDHSQYSSPACIELHKVLASYPLYQTLDQYSKEEPEYWLIVRKVDENLLKAFRALEKEKGYDLIGEKGFLSESEKNTPDISDELLRILKKL